MTLENILEIVDYSIACLGFTCGLAFWIYFFRIATSDK